MSRVYSRKANLKQIDLTRRVCQLSGVFMVYVKTLSDILSPHIPYKNLEYEQKEKIQHDFLPV